MSTGSTNGAINFRSWRNAAGHKPELNPTTPSLLFPTIFLLPSLGFANFPRLHFHIITTQSHLSQTLDPNQHTIQNTPNPKIAPNLPPPPPPPPPLLFKISTLKKKTHKVLQFEKFVPKTEEIRWKKLKPRSQNRREADQHSQITWWRYKSEDWSPGTSSFFSAENLSSPTLKNVCSQRLNKYRKWTQGSWLVQKQPNEIYIYIL